MKRQSPLTPRDGEAALAELCGLMLDFPYLVIGSVALQHYAPHALRRPPRDCDLLIPNDEAAIHAFAARMSAAGFELSSWDEPVTAPLPRGQLVGRIYLRARRGGWIVDATYECEPLPFAAAWTAREEAAGVNFAALDHVTRLMAVRGAPRDLRRLARLDPYAGRMEGASAWPVPTGTANAAP